MIDQERWTDEQAVETVAGNSGFNIWALLARRKWWVISFAILGAIGGGVYFLLAPAVYESYAQLIVIRRRPDIKSQGRYQGSDGNDTVVSKDDLATQLMVITSPKTIYQAIVKGKLDELPSLAANDAPLRTIMESVSVNRGGKGAAENSSVVTISYRGSDPSDCGAVLKAILASYQDNLANQFEGEGGTLLRMISQLRDDLGKKLLDQENGHRELMKAVPPELSWGKGKYGQNMHESRMADIATERFRVESKRIDLESKLQALLTAQKSDASPRTIKLLMDRISGPLNEIAAAEGSSKTDKVFELQSRLARMQELGLGEGHNEVRAIKRELEILYQTYPELKKEKAKSPKTAGTKTLEKSAAVAKDGKAPESKGASKASGDEDKSKEEASGVESYIQSVRLEIGAYAAQEKILDDKLKALQGQSRQLRDLELRDENMLAEIARTKELYNVVAQQVGEVNLLNNFGGYITNVISEPGYGYQVAPSLAISLAVGIFLGTVCGLSIGFLIDLGDKSFRSPEEIRSDIGVGVIGHVPIIIPEHEQSEANVSSTLDDRLDPMLCVYHTPGSRFAEAYRSVRTSLYFSTHGQGHKLIQITSPSRDDGKSTLAANLAISIAQSGRRCLLVDADFRRSRVHKLFTLSNDFGLSSIIHGEMEVPEAVRASGVENLSIITSGPRPSNPAELLTSPHFKSLLEMLRDQYEFVLIDTPPLLAVTDAAVVAPRVDGVLLALQITRRCRPLANQAAEKLAAMGANLLGIVVNGVGWKRSMAYAYINTFGSQSKYYRFVSDQFGLDGSGYIYGASEPVPSRNNRIADDLDAAHEAEEARS